MENADKKNLEQSIKILASLDTYACSNGIKNTDLAKEEIGFCSKCKKMIALRFTGCSYCSKHFCKAHREAHVCNVNQANCFKSKLMDGKSSFIDRLKQMRIKAGAK